MNFEVVNLSNHSEAFELLQQYNKRIGCSLKEDELNEWLYKILTIGNPLGVINNGEIVAFLLLYCNNLDTLEAYICNVYVDEKYRGHNLSARLVEEAIRICQDRNFKIINLDVSEDNFPAYKVYKLCGFNETNRYYNNHKIYLKMTYYL